MCPEIFLLSYIWKACARENICQCFVQRSAKNFFVSSRFFTDAARFNIYNNHKRSEENPHGVIQSRHQRQSSISVWPGIVGDCLLGSHVLPHKFPGNNYGDFLLHNLPKLLEGVPLAVSSRMCYMPPAHFIHAARDVLSNTYRDRWIGRGGPTAWPPRSPGLNPVDFYLCRHLNSLVHAIHADKKRHFTITLWMRVRLFATTLG
jgi:hypothetical protein